MGLDRRPTRGAPAPASPRPITERLGLLVVAVLVAAGMVAVTVAEGEPAPTERPTVGLSGAAPAPVESPSATPSPTPAPASGVPGGWVVSGADGTPVLAGPDGAVDEVAAPGLAWPILAEEDDGYRVATHCDREAWVASGDVERPTVARGEGLGGAVIVVDPGHGGIDPGAIGPDGLLERDVNLDVAERLQALLERSNDVNDETGAVTPGGQHPPVAAVVMTRDRDDGTGGDQRTSLAFRGQLATGVDADALLSIHHNAGDTTTFDQPATEVFYSVDDDGSRRLAGLVIEELRRSLAPLADQWRGTTDAGTIGRRDPDGTDYYTLLEEGTVPAVITEALYLSDPAGEALAATDDFQVRYAEALYRALVRFLDDPDEEGSEVNDPIEYSPSDSEAYDFSDCSLAVPISTDDETAD